MIRKLFRRMGFDVHRYYGHPNGGMPGDFTRAEARAWHRVKAYTMNSAEQIVAVRRAVNHAIRNEIPGAMVECGVWRGGIAAILAGSGRETWLYDTFCGLPEKGQHDGTMGSDDPSYSRCVAPLADVVAYLGSQPYYVRGDVRKTIPKHMPKQIAFLHLDTDFYESTAHELKHLWPLVSKGGVMIVDDYYLWTGVKKAVDEYLPGHHKHRVDEKAVAICS